MVRAGASESDLLGCERIVDLPWPLLLGRKGTTRDMFLGNIPLLLVSANGSGLTLWRFPTPDEADGHGRENSTEYSCRVLPRLHREPVPISARPFQLSWLGRPNVAHGSKQILTSFGPSRCKRRQANGKERAN